MSSNHTPFEPWQVLASVTLIERPPWLTVWEEHVALPGGHEIRDFLRCTGRDYAVVFALMEDGTVPMVQQYKHGIGRISVDLPAGYLDAGEDPLSAAQRELREETGVVAPQWRSLGDMVIDTNRGDTAAHLFVAFGGRRVAEQELDESEAIAVSFHTPEALGAMVFSGEIRTLATVAGIMTALRIL
jgi:8-oxo-dGTP pyrophosphatase MutT (NUDIX family)